jgi:hypothetical protein
MTDIRDNSILADVKGSLGYNPEEIDSDFDGPIITKINTAIGILARLGLGKLGSFIVNNGAETWNDLLGEEYRYIYPHAINLVETYVKLAFDTPQSGALKAALEEDYKTAEFDVQTGIELHNIEEAENE